MFLGAAGVAFAGIVLLKFLRQLNPFNLGILGILFVGSIVSHFSLWGIGQTSVALLVWLGVWMAPYDVD